MCSIAIAYDKHVLVGLAQLNSHRGSMNHSVAYVCDDLLLGFNKYRGQLDTNELPDINEGEYVIVHQQAPTQQTDNIHPAVYKEYCLWHNGIIKSEQMKKFQEQYDPNEEWDTQLLLRHYVDVGTFDNIDGSFACVLADDHGVYIFRNAIAPLYINEFGVSSIEFAGSRLLPHDKIFKITYHTDGLHYNEVDSFTSFNIPYII